MSEGDLFMSFYCYQIYKSSGIESNTGQPNSKFCSLYNIDSAMHTQSFTCPVSLFIFEKICFMS